MEKNTFSTKMLNKSENAFVFGAKAELRSRKVRIFSNERVAEVIGEIQGKLTEGLSSVAKKILANMLENYSHTVENTAKFHQLLSYTLETQGNLMVCDWVGNVRQLCNEIQRIVARAEDGEKITPEHLSTDLKKSAKSITQFSKGENVKPIASYDSLSTSFNISSSTGTLEEAVCGLETQMIKEALSRHKWNISQAARELGLTRRGLYMKIARYGVEKAA